MTEYGMCEMRPSQLRFTHDSVSYKFRNGVSLDETFRQILNDELDIHGIDCLAAMQYNGEWMVVRGNRRLYLYKKLEEVGKLTVVEVDKQYFQSQLFYRQFTSKNMGISLRIRGCSDIENKLNQIANEWRNHQTQSRSSRRRRRRSKSPRSSSTGSRNTISSNNYSVSSGRPAPTFSMGTISNSDNALTLTRPTSALSETGRFMGTNVDNECFPTTSTRQNSTWRDSSIHTGTISNRNYPLTRGRSESPATSLRMSSTGQYNLYSNTDLFHSTDTIRNGYNVLNATTSRQTPNKFSTAITQENCHYIGKSSTYNTPLGEPTTLKESTSYYAKPRPSTHIKPILKHDGRSQTHASPRTGPADVNRPSRSTVADISARGCCIIL
ncbi:uncharacterized protein [Argopecten irradians]|uniref:uncharacterized protein n=1 Tax=Argopecten irradians TaxID=31199 RepID=UPI0037127988